MYLYYVLIILEYLILKNLTTEYELNTATKSKETRNNVIIYYLMWLAS